ncbi:MAG: hypothetical protein WAW79_00375 [Steroidobacteraceae bacterium]
MLLATRAMPAAAEDPENIPVTELHPSHLGITIEAPGIEDWLVTEKRGKEGWHIWYRTWGDDDSTSVVTFRTDRYPAGGFAREHGSLGELARSVLAASRSPDNIFFREKSAELKRRDMYGVEAHHIRIVVEERNNRQFPGTALILEKSQLLMLHPHNPDQLISVSADTRYRLERDRENADELLSDFMETMEFQ